MNNTTIYICTHRDFIFPSNLKGDYKIITDGTDLQEEYPYPVIKANNILEPLKHCYSELYQIYDIWQNDKYSNYIGINHYRRYFDTQEFNEINETVLPPKMKFDGMNQYKNCHNIKDLEECIEIIEGVADYDTDISDGIYPCNMSVLSRGDFDAYCFFMFGVLQEFARRHNLHTDEDVRKYVSTWTNNVDYQSRLFGFLSERIGTIWFNNNIETARISNIKIIVP